MKFNVLLLALCPLELAARKGGKKSSKSEAMTGKSIQPSENGTICHGELGCFDDTIGGRLPGDPYSIPAYYHMFWNETQYVTLSWNDTKEVFEEQTAGLFDAEKELIFIVHGFTQSYRSTWVWDLKAATAIAYPDANIVLVDWSHGASSYAAANVPMIANMTVLFTRKLMTMYSTVKAEKIYVIGFSLGAQIAGFFARSFTQQTGSKIGRITSCDAASPIFEAMDIAPHRGDADFVEAIHTSAGNRIIRGKFGYISPYADIDFYPNGGVIQRGCSYLSIQCAHERSVVYLTHAFEDAGGCQFRGNRCNNTGEAFDETCAGPYVDFYLGQKDWQSFARIDGDYHIVYLRTRKKSPFCFKP